MPSCRYCFIKQKLAACHQCLPHKWAGHMVWRVCGLDWNNTLATSPADHTSVMSHTFAVKQRRDAWTHDSAFLLPKAKVNCKFKLCCAQVLQPKLNNSYFHLKIALVSVHRTERYFNFKLIFSITKMKICDSTYIQTHTHTHIDFLQFKTSVFSSWGFKIYFLNTDSFHCKNNNCQK